MYNMLLLCFFELQSLIDGSHVAKGKDRVPLYITGHLEILEQTSKIWFLLEKLKFDLVSRCKQLPEFFDCSNINFVIETDYTKSAKLISKHLKEIYQKAGLRRTNNLEGKFRAIAGFVSKESFKPTLQDLSDNVERLIIRPKISELVQKPENVDIDFDWSDDDQDITDKNSDECLGKKLISNRKDLQAGSVESGSTEIYGSDEEMDEVKGFKRPPAFSSDSDGDRKYPHLHFA